MTALEIIPLILFVVVIVTSIAEKTNIPYPLLLVVVGLLVGFIPSVPNWRPPSDVILEIFLPPILFATARTISFQDIKKYQLTIYSLSIALVVVSTLLVALFLSAAIPAITFSSALVLGAIISPTDTVAAVAILSKLSVNRSIIKSIEIESLFNDATGIVLYGAAIFYVSQGNINLIDISLHTLFVGFGGILIGGLLALLTHIIIIRFLTHSENELPIIMGLVLAFVAYILADRLDTSGVLAVVTAGLMHKKSERRVFAETRLKEATVWSSFIFFLNGIIFIVIGLQFPRYLQRLNHFTPLELIYYPLLTIAGLFFLRFFWVSLTCIFDRYVLKSTDDFETTTIPWRKIAIISWAGLKGLVPLALAIALPLTTASNDNFPNRDIIIYLTITTILFSLLVQGLSLPRVISALGVGHSGQTQYKNTSTIYQQLTRYSVKYINGLGQHSGSPEARRLIENYYANRLLHVELQYDDDASARKTRLDAKHLLNVILQRERRLLAELRTADKISEEIYILLLRKLDRDEVGFVSYT